MNHFSGAHWNLQSIASQLEAQVMIWTWIGIWNVYQGQGSLVGIWHYLWECSVRFELNCKTPSWFQRITWCCMEIPFSYIWVVKPIHCNVRKAQKPQEELWLSWIWRWLRRRSVWNKKEKCYSKAVGSIWGSFIVSTALDFVNFIAFHVCFASFLALKVIWYFIFWF